MRIRLSTFELELLGDIAAAAGADHANEAVSVKRCC